MKKLSLIAALALGGLMTCSTLVIAQDAPKADAKQGGKKGYSVEQQLDRLTTQLSLTDEQKPKVKAVLEETSKKLTEVRNDSSLDQAARREKMKPIFDAQNTKMKAILTPDQYTKYEENQQKMKKGGKKKSE